MQSDNRTILALSSGKTPSGVAVIRISGPEVKRISVAMTGSTLAPRIAHYRKIVDPDTGAVLDQGIVILFEHPASFTGEDCMEFQVHGGPAVVKAVMDAVLTFDGVRLAEAGEFSRRAFENGRLDLTEIEGLADLIAAETEAQRRLALSQSQGDLRNLYEGWRSQIIRIRALIEAELDFAEEEDVPVEISQAGLALLAETIKDIGLHLDDDSIGEIVRDGFKIALMGKPNVGKSSLLNALAKRDVAIVTDTAGTTRDVIDVDLDLNGYAVTISDTAGIRTSQDIIEQEGIKRAERRGGEADLVVWLVEAGDDVPDLSRYRDRLVLTSKDDEGLSDGFSISSKTGHGIGEFIDSITKRIENRLDGHESGLITRIRYRKALTECIEHLVFARDDVPSDIEIRAESLRKAGDCIGRITGRIDVEDLLDVIFAEFCVGK